MKLTNNEEIKQGKDLKSHFIKLQIIYKMSATKADHVLSNKARLLL